jgi:hypothetical protein
MKMQSHSTGAKYSSSYSLALDKGDLGFEEVLDCKTLASATVWDHSGFLISLIVSI